MVKVNLKAASQISEDSWLNEPKYEWFREVYQYASFQTRAIPALHGSTPEEMYFAITAMMHKMGLRD
jgi:hypothetical protein